MAHPDPIIIRLAREAIAEAFERIGGVDALVDWIEADEANRKTFFGQVYPRLLAYDVDPPEAEWAPRALTWQPPTPPPE